MRVDLIKIRKQQNQKESWGKCRTAQVHGLSYLDDRMDRRDHVKILSVRTALLWPTNIKHLRHIEDGGLFLFRMKNNLGRVDRKPGRGRRVGYEFMGLH